jgi:hypothetical protein
LILSGARGVTCKIEGFPGREDNNERGSICDPVFASCPGMLS